MFGRNGRRHQAEFGQHIPVFLTETMGLRLIGAAALNVIALGRKAVGQSLKHHLFFAEIEIHGFAPLDNNLALPTGQKRCEKG